MKRCKCKSQFFIIKGNVNCEININGKRLRKLNIYVKESSQIQCNYINIIKTYNLLHKVNT